MDGLVREPNTLSYYFAGEDECAEVFDLLDKDLQGKDRLSIEFEVLRVKVTHPKLWLEKGIMKYYSDNNTKVSAPRHQCLLQSGALELKLYFSRDKSIISVNPDRGDSAWLTKVAYYMDKLIDKIKQHLQVRVDKGSMDLGHVERITDVLTTLQKHFYVKDEIEQTGNPRHLPLRLKEYAIEAELRMGLYKLEKGGEVFTRLYGPVLDIVLRLFNLPVDLTLEGNSIVYKATAADITNSVLPINAINMARTYINHLTPSFVVKAPIPPKAKKPSPTSTRPAPRIATHRTSPTQRIKAATITRASNQRTPK